MALHQLTSVTIGVPNVSQTAAYYADFGLTDLGDGTFATIDGGRQLRIALAPTRRLVDLTVGADDPADLHRIAAALPGRVLPAAPGSGTARGPGAGVAAGGGGTAAEARARGHRLHGLRGHEPVLHRRARIQGQRLHQGGGRVPAVLDRPSQRAGAVRAGELPAPHVLAG